jgi:hypothetical protein
MVQALDDAPLSPGSTLRDLRADARWIGWRWECIKNKNGERVSTKIPYARRQRPQGRSRQCAIMGQL